MHIDMSEYDSQYLEELGWNLFFQKHFQMLKIPGSVPARISSESKSLYRVYSQYGELTVKISGKLRYRVGIESPHPAVGDWVVIKPRINEKTGIIHSILPRKSNFSRKVAGERTQEQVVASNIDTVFIVSGLDGGRNFNLRRIERYLTLAWNSGASPVVVLNKMDLCPDIGPYVQKVEAIATDIPIHSVSAKERIGLDALRKYLTKGNTAAFLGSSGVGKSALINSLLGADRQETREVREDDRMGRHTTTRRELILLPGGGVVIDTPGMRELQMWVGEDDLQDTFYDIAILSQRCRFQDCTHNTEPDCAVRDAVATGALDSARLESYRKLKNELSYLALREEHGTRLQEKAKWKKISQWSKEMRKQTNR